MPRLEVSQDKSPISAGSTYRSRNLARLSSSHHRYELDTSKICMSCRRCTRCGKFKPSGTIDKSCQSTSCVDRSSGYVCQICGVCAHCGPTYHCGSNYFTLEYLGLSLQIPEIDTVKEGDVILRYASSSIKEVTISRITSTDNEKFQIDIITDDKRVTSKVSVKSLRKFAGNLNGITFPFQGTFDDLVAASMEEFKNRKSEQLVLFNSPTLHHALVLTCKCKVPQNVSAPIPADSQHLPECTWPCCNEIWSQTACRLKGHIGFMLCYCYKNSSKEHVSSGFGTCYWSCCLQVASEKVCLRLTSTRKSISKNHRAKKVSDSIKGFPNIPNIGFLGAMDMLANANNTAARNSGETDSFRTPSTTSTGINAFGGSEIHSSPLGGPRVPLGTGSLGTGISSGSSNNLRGSHGIPPFSFGTSSSSGPSSGLVTPSNSGVFRSGFGSTPPFGSAPSLGGPPPSSSGSGFGAGLTFPVHPPPSLGGPSSTSGSGSGFGAGFMFGNVPSLGGPSSSSSNSGRGSSGSGFSSGPMFAVPPTASLGGPSSTSSSGSGFSGFSSGPTFVAPPPPSLGGPSSTSSSGSGFGAGFMFGNAPSLGGSPMGTPLVGVGGHPMHANFGGTSNSGRGSLGGGFGTTAMFASTPGDPYRNAPNPGQFGISRGGPISPGDHDLQLHNMNQITELDSKMASNGPPPFPTAVLSYMKLEENGALVETSTFHSSYLVCKCSLTRPYYIRLAAALHSSASSASSSNYFDENQHLLTNKAPMHKFGVCTWNCCEHSWEVKKCSRIKQNNSHVGNLRCTCMSGKHIPHSPVCRWSCCNEPPYVRICSQAPGNIGGVSTTSSIRDSRLYSVAHNFEPSPEMDYSNPGLLPRRTHRSQEMFQYDQYDESTDVTLTLAYASNDYWYCLPCATDDNNMINIAEKSNRFCISSLK